MKSFLLLNRNMLPRISKVKVLGDLLLCVSFEDGSCVSYDLREDINEIPAFKALEETIGLFRSFTVDASRTCISWTDQIDLPSDTIREYGTPMEWE